MSIDAPGGPFGYLRIYGFDTDAGAVHRRADAPDPAAAGSRPDHRRPRQPGRLHLGGRAGAAAVHAESHRADALLRAGDAVHARDRRLSATSRTTWRRGRRRSTPRSATASCMRRPIPITDPDACNAIGQQYGGPVVLVGDSTTYSAGDLFSAGFVDNGIGPVHLRRRGDRRRRRQRLGLRRAADRRSPARRRRCRRCPTASTCRCRSGVPRALGPAKACRSRTSASRARRTR